jgi:hypothetical protein
MWCLLRVSGEAMMSWCQASWERTSTSWMLKVTGHVTTSEPSSSGRRVCSHRTRGDTGALPCQVACLVPRGTWRCQSSPALGAGLEPRDTWRYWSSSLSGGVTGVMRHVAMPELSGTRSRSGAAGTHGDTGALPYRVRSLALWCCMTRLTYGVSSLQVPTVIIHIHMVFRKWFTWTVCIINLKLILRNSLFYDGIFWKSPMYLSTAWIALEFTMLCWFWVSGICSSLLGSFFYVFYALCRLLTNSEYTISLLYKSCCICRHISTLAGFYQYTLWKQYYSGTLLVAFFMISVVLSPKIHI